MKILAIVLIVLTLVLLISSDYSNALGPLGLGSSIEAMSVSEAQNVHEAQHSRSVLDLSTKLGVDDASFLNNEHIGPGDNVNDSEHTAILELINGIEQRLLASFTKTFDDTVGQAKRTSDEHKATLDLLLKQDEFNMARIDSLKEKYNDAVKGLKASMESNDVIKTKLLKQLQLLAGIRHIIFTLKYPQSLYQGFDANHNESTETWGSYCLTDTKYAETNAFMVPEASGNIRIQLKGIWSMHFWSMSYSSTCEEVSWSLSRIFNRDVNVASYFSDYWCAWYMVHLTANLNLQENDIISAKKFQVKREGKYYLWHGGWFYSGVEMRYLTNNDTDLKKAWLYQDNDQMTQDWSPSGWIRYKLSSNIYKPISIDANKYFRSSEGLQTIVIEGMYRITWTINPWFQSNGNSSGSFKFPDTRRGLRFGYCSDSNDTRTCRIIHAQNHFSPWGKSDILEYTMNMIKGSAWFVEARHFASTKGNLWNLKSDNLHSLSIIYEGTKDGEGRFQSWMGGCTMNKDPKFIMANFGNYLHYSNYTDSTKKLFNQSYFWSKGWRPHCANTVGHDTFATGSLVVYPDGTFCPTIPGFYRFLSVIQSNNGDADSNWGFTGHYQAVFIKRPNLTKPKSNDDDWGRIMGYTDHTSSYYGTYTSRSDYTMALSAGQCFGVTFFQDGDYNDSYDGRRHSQSEFHPETTANFDSADSITEEGYGNSFIHVSFVGSGGPGTA